MTTVEAITLVLKPLAICLVISRKSLWRGLLGLTYRVSKKVGRWYGKRSRTYYSSTNRRGNAGTLR